MGEPAERDGVARAKTGPDPLLTERDLPTVRSAILSAAGLKTATAEKLGVSSATLYRYIARFPELNAVFEEVNERMLDLAEGNIVKALQAGDKRVSRWFLETRGKHRGYTRQFNLAPAGASPGEEMEVTTIDTSLLSLETLRELEAATIDPRDDVIDAEVVLDDGTDAG